MVKHLVEAQAKSVQYGYFLPFGTLVYDRSYGLYGVILETKQKPITTIKILLINKLMVVNEPLPSFKEFYDVLTVP